MALTFNFGDLPEVAQLASVHPDPAAYWAWIQTVTTNSDLIEVAQHFEAAWIASGTSPIAESARTADAIQELQAIEQRLTLVRSIDTGQGQIIEAQVHLDTVSV